jgi:hypothetical protein
MGNGIQISRLGERFSSHTGAARHPRRNGITGDTRALREKLLTATVETLADGSDPRLG